MSYTNSGLLPNQNYNIDLHYQNYQNAGMPVRTGYGGYQVCIWVNGVLKSNTPSVLNIDEPSTVRRTYTFTATSNNAGVMDLKFDWINDDFSPSTYDANFEIQQMDIYRTLNAAGQLVYLEQLQSKSLAGAKSIIDRFIPPAYAYAATLPSGCGGNSCLVRLYSNYTSTNTAFNSTSNGVDFEFSVPNETRKGWINVNTLTDTVSRVIQ
jgi:hypothetical protein